MIKIVAIGIICGILIIYLKSINSELYSLALIGSGILILYLGFEYLLETLKIFNVLFNMSGINEEFINIILKISSIGILIEFGAGTLEDMGLKGLSDKMIFVGKIIIIFVSLPIFYALINIVVRMIQ